MLAGGGGEVPDLDESCWLSPALLAGIDSRSRLAQDEIFGPVAVLYSYDPGKRRRSEERSEAGIL